MNFIDNQKPTRLISWRSLLCLVFLLVALAPPSMALAPESDSDCHGKATAAHHGDNHAQLMNADDADDCCMQDCASEDTEQCMDDNALGCAFTGNAAPVLVLHSALLLDLQLRRPAIALQLVSEFPSRLSGPELRPPITHI